MNNNTVYIYWTGGYDSTYRIIQLSLLNISIQPIYISDSRKSEQQEIEAIRSIKADLLNFKRTKAEFLDLIYVKRTDVLPNVKISAAYKFLKKDYAVGSQYEWLACYAAQKNIKVELGLEDMPNTPNLAFLTSSKFEEVKLPSGVEYYCLSKDNEPNCYELFSNFYYPLPLYYETKLEMLDWCKKEGYMDVIKKTWFCHTPIDSEPCGLCNPCVQVVESGMSFRLSRKAKLRYKVFRSSKLGFFVLRVFRKIGVIIKR